MEKSTQARAAAGAAALRPSRCCPGRLPARMLTGLPAPAGGAAQMIKEGLDKKFGSSWHVVVGKAFAYNITFEVRWVVGCVVGAAGAPPGAAKRCGAPPVLGGLGEPGAALSAGDSPGAVLACAG